MEKTSLKRRESTYMKELRKKWEENPIVEKLENDPIPEISKLEEAKTALNAELQQAVARHAQAKNLLEVYNQNVARLVQARAELDQVTLRFNRWHLINSHFGGTRFRTLAQTYILRPLLNNANIFLEKITDRYKLTCSEENEKLSILVIDRYNKDAVRSATVLSGGERFMVSLALSLALSSLNKPDMNVNILFIDEGFGTLDEKSLESLEMYLEDHFRTSLPPASQPSGSCLGLCFQT